MNAAKRHDIAGRALTGAMLAAAAIGLAACDKKADEAPTSAPQAATDGSGVATASGASWKRLPDGSSFRSSGGTDSERQEADRCWPDSGSFDCLNVDVINFEGGAITVVARTRADALPSAPSTPPAQGFSCAIYPKVVEQRFIGAGAEPQRNDDTDGSLWRAADVARLEGVGAASDFVDCKVIAAIRTGTPVTTLLSAPDFPRATVAPGAPS